MLLLNIHPLKHFPLPSPNERTYLNPMCLFKSKSLLGSMSSKSVLLDSSIPPVLLGIKESICNVKQICNVNTNLKHFFAQYHGWSLWDTSTMKIFYLWLKASTVNGPRWKESLSLFCPLVHASCRQAVLNGDCKSVQGTNCSLPVPEKRKRIQRLFTRTCVDRTMGVVFKLRVG